MTSTIPEPPEHVPDSVSALFVEAHECLSAGATTAAVVMARATIEGVAKDKGVQDSRLVDMIKSLMDGGHISVLLMEAAHVVRLSGNIAIHEVLDERFSAREASDVLELVGKILKQVYKDPAEVARMRQWIDGRRNDTV
ncbi:DUF4145 domain-containing protein [Streptosporangiaceae bacterium NEAU-GS5]|nr:DUF4145 domain-containing protein [Streptosporangiaceae bacterium NEAU-GS5]